MELRHIRYFIAAAEEGNLTKAAARLGISQPPLSMQIRDLEDEIGAALFHRSAHGIHLTEAGAAFLNAVKPIQQRAEDAMKIAKRVANGEQGQLNIGFTGSAALNPIVPASIREFQKYYPHVNLRIEEGNSTILIGKVLKDELDLVIVTAKNPVSKDLKIQHLKDEPLVAVISQQHRLANQSITQAFDLQQLHNDAFIMTPLSETGMGLYDALVDACRGVGFEPKIGQHAPQLVSILSLVSANLGVSLVPESSKQLQLSGLKYYNLTEPVPTVALTLAYKTQGPSQCAINFASVIQSLCHQAEDALK
ncbi:LysR substrate-binding domain-containing protein [Acinetobacter sp. MD2(2019)]|uniref:LysR substrate-binding domain-containing protein n=1 Tax=Acinetobacter sp. MD2(2019) TaxID=2605273 RepID=UPI002D1EA9BB|nr:LysR substrate-binding domain-containing protein [Acinetobacter sp. MD2(2019)]MEB3753840.1 LysR family transcriptional regulator [Acinetobacter sp. MD2(2019)]